MNNTITDAERNLLAVMAAEQADNSALAMPLRDAWFEIAERVNAAVETSDDRFAVSELVRIDLEHQTCTTVKARYLDLALRFVSL